MRPYQVIIWDWNGTLADDVMASLRSTNDILARRNMPPIDLETYYSYIDSPISKFYEHLFDLSVVPMEVLGEEFYDSYPQYFEGLHQGVEELVKKLSAEGFRQIVLTAGNTEVVTGDLKRFGILDYFEEVLGADDLLAAGKVERGLHWIAGQRELPKEMVLIGDTLHDYDTAKAMGVDVILCAIGHQSKKDLLTAGVPVMDRFEDLRELLLSERKTVAKRIKNG